MRTYSRYPRFLTVLGATLLLLPGSAAADGCDESPAELRIEEVTATAGTLANLRGANGSLRSESARLLAKADALTAAHAPPAAACKSGCVPEAAPQLVLRSVPERFLSDYGDKALCSALLSRTTAAPLTYHDRSFSSVDELNDWFGRFSQGEGADGEDLYERCPGACSPQYTTVVSRNGAGYRVDADVRCGHARDKDNNNYILSLSYRWQCKAGT